MAAEAARDATATPRRFRSWAAIASKVLHADGGARPDGSKRHEPCPETWPELVHVELAHGELATDANGRSLYQEMESWFRAEGVEDDGMKAAYRTLWRALEAEVSRYYYEKHERLREESGH